MRSSYSKGGRSAQGQETQEVHANTALTYKNGGEAQKEGRIYVTEGVCQEVYSIKKIQPE